MSLPAELSCLQGSGGAEGETTLATLEKQLICPICLELFNKPVVILPCQHNLCRKCANELYQPSLFQARTTMQVSSGRFRCPSCRQEVVLDRHGVYGLQRNLLVENIIDVYKQEVSNNHNTASPRPLPPCPPAAQVTCSDHEGERVSIYCLTCQVPTCSLCKVFGAHQSCQVAPLTDIYQQKKDELSEGVSSLVAVNDKVQALINELEETCRKIEENCTTQKQSVCEKFSRVFSILEERQKMMTQQISSEQEEKTDHVQVLLRRYGDNIQANSKLMEGAASSMEEPDMGAFVQNSRELITKVIAATSCCPTETLKPGYETLRRYRFNFSRQERALRSIDFLKAVEDVPEAAAVEQQPEEPKEPSVQNVETKLPQGTSTQNQESVTDPVKELIPTLIPPPVEPASAPVREPAGAVLQPGTEDPDLNDGGSGLMKTRTAEEKEEAEGCAAPDPVKEGNVCEEQDGMSTQQCGAVSDAGDWTAQSETEDKEEDMLMMKNEERDATFYPCWYKPTSWCTVSPDPAEMLLEVCDAEQKMCSPPTEGSDAGIQTDAEWADQVLSEPQSPPRSPWSLVTKAQTREQSMFDPDPPPPGPQLPPSSELHTQPHLPLPPPPHQSETRLQSQPQKVPDELDSAFKPVPQMRLTKQAAGEDGTGENNEAAEEEEDDMQGWVCLPGAVDKSFGLEDDSFDLGDASSDNNESPSSVPPEEASSSEMDKGNFDLSDRRIEDAEETEQHHEDKLDPNCASELRGKVSGEGEAEPVNEELEEGSMCSHEREEKMEDGSVSLDAGGHGVGANSSLIQGDGDTGLEAGSSESAEQQEDGKQLEEKIPSRVSLQAVTLLFYLLAFLVILQRVWAYIGCFICT